MKWSAEPKWFMPTPDDRTSLAHMLRYAQDAAAFIQGRVRQDLDTDRMLYLAVLRALEVIGEAATRVSQPKQDQHPEIPWPQIIALRNRLIHGYDAVDSDRLWQILASDVPKLISDLQNILAQP
jgi:uncharacterized protein with HEPN domain